MDLLFIKPLKTILDTSLLELQYNSRLMTTKALNNISSYFTIFFSIVNIFDLLLKESLLFIA